MLCCTSQFSFPHSTAGTKPLLYWVFPKEKSCSLKNQNLCNWGQPFHVSVSKHFRICRTLCKEYKHGFGRLAQTFLKARWLGWFLIQHLKLFFCWRWENSVFWKTLFRDLCYDFVSAFIHLKTQKNPRERKFAFLLWSQLKSWTLVQVNSSPVLELVSGQSGDTSLCQWPLVLWMKGSLVSRITETLLKTNVPWLTNGGKKVGLEEYSNINSWCKVKFSDLRTCG